MNEGLATRHDPSAAMTPRATYRLQLHRDFNFEAAAALTPYLAKLGISHVYASPILAARAGSTHGYDVVDPTRVSPELGGEPGLRHWVARLREHGMGLIADIVPNHMAVGGADNPWWLDVMEWGPESLYADFFDIDWDAVDPALTRRVLAPFLGRPYGEALEAGDVRLKFDVAAGRLYIGAHDAHRFGVAPALYAPLLQGTQDEMLIEIGGAFRDALAPRGGRSARRRAFDAVCTRLAAAISTQAASRSAVDDLLARHAHDAAEGPARLHKLLEQQHYRLAWWRTAPDEINWRRFFDVTDLAGLRIQDKAVFEAVHATTFRLYAEGWVDGVRVDHIDGLADPRAYCRKLRRRLDLLSRQRPAALPRERAYFIVEKILAPGEKLARDWCTDGTSGYVFMNEVSAVLHDGAGREPLARLWRECSGRSGNFQVEEQEARRRIPQQLFSADFNACAHALHRIARSDPVTRDWTLAAIRRALAEILVHFPVYRTYADARGRSRADAAIMAQVIEQAQRSSRPGERPLLPLIDRWLGAEPVLKRRGAAARRERLRALARFQQLTSPVAAKSVEDTAFYRFGLLLSRNEVGANPAQFSMTPGAFHGACAARQRRYPRAMLATATHDHKRGEDLRARQAVLSEVTPHWATQVAAWRRDNDALKGECDGARGPDSTDEYVLYQMLVGAWPMDLTLDDSAGVQEWVARLQRWQRKAVREAKRRSGWAEPNLAYEQACERFLDNLFHSQRAPIFVTQLQRFVDRLAAPGALNALAQTLLRLTTPGVPDTYQGTELWDFSLVDPDNRRPVDYRARAHHLDDMAPDAALLQCWRDGRIKQRLMARVLSLRHAVPALFSAGAYTALRVRGRCADHVLAFVREHAGQMMVVAVPVHTVALRNGADSLAVPSEVWGDTQIELPAGGAPRRWVDALGGRLLAASTHIRVAELFGMWPLALIHTLAERPDPC